MVIVIGKVRIVLSLVESVRNMFRNGCVSMKFMLSNMLMFIKMKYVIRLLLNVKV